METYIFEINETDEGERIDKFIASQIETLTRSFIQKLIKDGLAKVNGKTVKPGYNLKCADQVSFELPPSVEPDIAAEDIPLEVLYEDDDLLVVNKPKGMVVHPAAGHFSGTLVNAIMFHCRGNLSGINGVMRPGIVHRIDKDTSGSLIICKNDLSHAGIAEQLKEHSCKRIYHAIVYGHLPQEEGIVNAPIARDPNNRLRMAVRPQSDPSAKHAITHYQVLKYLNGFTYIACRLETGRTHQIRVHMSSIGHPILGDDLYANGHTSKLKCQGQTLHAKTIGFIHPRSGEYLELDTELPDYFKHFLNILSD